MHLNTWSLSRPRPEGMPPIFFQSYWFAVGDDISTTVMDYFNDGHLPAEVNHTYITLIPNV